ncbi:conserved hypothetical protein [Candidatus Terasakiella magnetica]|uniref:SiaC family regulatory phosphoprotein domain-containing protein n=1 Tax=Candidatus Terasakiella magnetica TaxID=1867952 RepID=A0A1C3RDF2_9PROT|nr:DUF1987 domain-containing protein [Candidatus Terasakiella magnetica]SCA55323.1 conserved hypothetical protein [Candidatus Terasakiella magnetica]
MENIKLAGTENYPAVDFKFSENTFKLSGESFMEDVTCFYGELIGKLEEHLAEQKSSEIVFIFDLEYFNSSSSRVIFNLFELLDQTTTNDNKVIIEWHFDDEDLGEEGEMLAEDIKHAEFKLIEKE